MRSAGTDCALTPSAFMTMASAIDGQITESYFLSASRSAASGIGPSSSLTIAMFLTPLVHSPASTVFGS